MFQLQRFGGLWTHTGFRNFWLAHTIAQFGAQISTLVVPLGALAGGPLGQYTYLRTILFIAVAGKLLAVLWFLLSPLRRMKHVPARS